MKWLIYPWWVGIAILCLGCQGSKQPLVPVRGIVTYQGEPLQQGMIVFTPDNSRGTSGPFAHGLIQKDGSFSLVSDEKPGAIPGWHRITVISVIDPQGDPGSQRFQIPAPLLPEKYRNPNLSGLVEEIKADQENVINLQLN